MTTAPVAPTSANPAKYALLLGALGVVFGDIGTSPLYAFEIVFSDAIHPVAVTQDNVYGILSLFLWTLIVVVTIKYVVLVMRFDNAGEGGIVALMTLLLGKLARNSRMRRWFVPLGIAGAALFYGDAIITPAISVVSAVEGLETISPALQPYVLPVSIVILVALFLFQKQGTERIAKIFGPTMLVWFIILALLGISAIIKNPHVLQAINPYYAFHFIQSQPLVSFFVLGAVVLCVTGAEALYADMGHFGATPIRRAWIIIALPSLLLNYLGQGALVLTTPEYIHNPFFRLAPDWGLHALVILATFATIIASQAVISGIFSMTQQLVQLKMVPRMRVIHTSEKALGQVYLPAVNWALMVLVITTVLIFQTSNAMGGAYGIAVTGTMLITDLFIIAALIQLRKWHWSIALCTVLPLLIIDILFFSANTLKIANGGWLPIATSMIIFIVMTTWIRGVRSITAYEQKHSQTLATFTERVKEIDPFRSKGTAICLTSDPTIAPTSLVLITEKLRAVPENVVCLNIEIDEVPTVKPSQRRVIENLGQGIYAVTLRYGYNDRIILPREIAKLLPDGDNQSQRSYFINRWTFDIRPGDWAVWRKRLFILVFRNATPAGGMFEMPTNQVIEIGTRMTI